MGSATEKEYQWSNRPKLAIEPDRSSAERKPEKQPHCLTITFDDHVVVGVVVDCSADGLGVQTFEPLPLGTDVTVEGTITVAGSWMTISGPARVALCEPDAWGAYQVGLDCKDAAWAEALDPDVTFEIVSRNC